MEILFDPTIWAGLVTLVVLEIVLGIDNLIFIAILSDKLPPEQRQKARIIGLTLALLMRLVLLASITWLATLTTPLFNLMGSEISARDLIMLVGGTFLLFKATMELHEKLEGSHREKDDELSYASFWPVILQIVILDAVFSIDAVITAMGMTEHLPVMMISVIIAMILMMIASNPLMNFVSTRPTVVILCLGFLLMIGFSLIVEGFDYHIPKGYLYAAIGFSVIIEAFNQLAQQNRRKTVKKMDARTRVSEAVISLLGMKSAQPGLVSELSVLAPSEKEMNVFKPEERLMIGRVLQLAQQPVSAIMTPRNDLYWIDLEDSRETLQREIQDCPYSCLVIAGQGSIDEPSGMIQKKDLADHFISGKTLDTLHKLVLQPVALPENLTVLQTMDSFRKNRIHVGFVIDEYGSLLGLVTLTDVIEAIAGDMPEDHEEDDFQQERKNDGSFVVNGNLTLQELQEIMGPDIDWPNKGNYTTAAGVALNMLRKLPQKGDTFELSGWSIKIEKMNGRRVSRMRLTKNDS
ncbi:MAG: TerC family protein [Alphaproteobacteria bacterium]|jgi:CBS domain containing-hemolysin-like protein|nr:TerC family protein [Alphaproteobacteria bacterium]QQS57380.1 MAG: TerC family protein [Alphaproteobacteria bacterium]